MCVKERGRERKRDKKQGKVTRIAAISTGEEISTLDRVRETLSLPMEEEGVIALDADERFIWPVDYVNYSYSVPLDDVSRPRPREREREREREKKREKKTEEERGKKCVEERLCRLSTVFLVYKIDLDR